MRYLLALAATVALAAPAYAQYYAPQPGYPPPGYAPQPGYDRGPPGYPPPGYDRRPEFRPREDERPEYRPREYDRPVLGQRCMAEFRLQDGRPRRIVCPIVRAKPVGEDCVCPPPPPPPGYPPGDYIPGRTVR